MSAGLGWLRSALSATSLLVACAVVTATMAADLTQRAVEPKIEQQTPRSAQPVRQTPSDVWIDPSELVEV